MWDKLEDNSSPPTRYVVIYGLSKRSWFARCLAEASPLFAPTLANLGIYGNDPLGHLFQLRLFCALVDEYFSLKVSFVRDVT